MWCLGLTTRAGTVVVSCTTGKYHDIALATGQYHRYCPGGSFDLRHRWDTSIDVQIRRFDSLIFLRYDYFCSELVKIHPKTVRNCMASLLAIYGDRRSKPKVEKGFFLYANSC